MNEYIIPPIPAGGFQFEQGGKPSAFADQFVGRTHLQNTAMFQHDHPVGSAGGGQAVCHSQDRPPVQDGFLLQRLAEGSFAGAVNGRGGLVKQQDGRIPDQGARQREQLALPGGKLHPAARSAVDRRCCIPGAATE